jgi:hypothetical protein
MKVTMSEDNEYPLFVYERLVDNVDLKKLLKYNKLSSTRTTYVMQYCIIECSDEQIIMTNNAHQVCKE